MEKLPRNRFQPMIAKENERAHSRQHVHSLAGQSNRLSIPFSPQVVIEGPLEKGYQSAIETYALHAAVSTLPKHRYFFVWFHFLYRVHRPIYDQNRVQQPLESDARLHGQQPCSDVPHVEYSTPNDWRVQGWAHLRQPILDHQEILQFELLWNPELRTNREHGDWVGYRVLVLASSMPLLVVLFAPFDVMLVYSAEVVYQDIWTCPMAVCMHPLNQ